MKNYILKAVWQVPRQYCNTASPRAQGSLNFIMSLEFFRFHVSLS